MQRYRVVIMLVLFGVVPVVVAFFVALSFLGKQEVEQPRVEVRPAVEAEPPPPETTAVLSASRDLAIGTLIGEGDLEVLELEDSEVGSEQILADGDASAREVRGYAVRRALAAGEPISWSALVGPGQNGFLAAVLRPGTRAVTVRVGQATGQARLIDPGDRVDVILSAELRVDEQESRVFARTIVQDARVVAVDQRLNGEEADDSDLMTATLEVSPPDGDRMVLAEHEGRISLAVRSLATMEGVPPGEAVVLQDMLLPPELVALSEERRLREGELKDLALRTQLADSRELLHNASSEERRWLEREQAALSLMLQIAESKDQLRGARKRAGTTSETVRIYRGVEPAQEVVFEHPPGTLP